MAIKIQTKKPEIPVEIGDLVFSFDVSDEAIKKFRVEAAKVQKEFQSISDKDEEQALNQAKDALRRGFAIMLGEGSFDQIYSLYPSIMTCMNYFVQLVEGIERELKDMGISQSQQELAQKYISRKK